MRWLGAVIVMCAAACATKQRDQEVKPALVRTTQAPPSLALSADGPLPEHLQADTTWQLAKDGDPMHLAQLAADLGAVRLTSLVEQGGRQGAVALAAFALAPDAHAERAQLCGLLPRLQPPFREQALRGLVSVYDSAARYGETLHGDADQRCLEQLGALNQLGNSGQLSDAERDLVSACEQHVAD